MKAMILAAGSGMRMRPLTENIPKVLLPVKNKPLIVHHIERLQKAGFKDIVINIAHFPEKIQAALGDGRQFNVNIQYSLEPPGGLETAGGILQALPLLGDSPFAIINGDIFTDYPFEALKTKNPDLAHLVLVDNPAHNGNGDFALHEGEVLPQGSPKYTYSGIAVYHPVLFANLSQGIHRLGLLLKESMQSHSISGEHYKGLWLDIGTPERLNQVNSQHV